MRLPLFLCQFAATREARVCETTQSSFALARVSKSVDEADLKSAALGRTGSSPVPRTISLSMALKVFNLGCSAGHRFEGWFASSEDFDAQSARRLIECPVCGDAEVSKLPSAPRLNLGVASVRRHRKLTP